MTIVVVGSINLDIIYSVERLPNPHEKLRAAGCLLCGGGAAANTAYWLGRLGNKVRMVGVVGDDPSGDTALRGLTSAGVDVSHVVTLKDVQTSVASIFVGPNRKCMVTGGGPIPAQYKTAILKSLDSALDPSISHIHLASRDTEIRQLVLQRADPTSSVSLEANGVYDLQTLERADLVFTNYDELSFAFPEPDPVSALLANGRKGLIQLIYITKGSQGALLAVGDTSQMIPTLKVEAIDRTGGGDAFDAATIDCYLKGGTPIDSARAGLALASKVICRLGGQSLDVNVN